MMNKGKYIIPGLMALLTAGCSDNGSTPADEPTAAPYSIALSVDAGGTVKSRTSVADPDDNLRGKQHVTRVQLFIYSQDDDGKDYTCVASEDVKWTHLKGAIDGLPTQTQRYTTTYQDYKDGVNYKFFAVGFDDTYSGDTKSPNYDNTNSVAAYGEPNSIAATGDKLSTGTFKLQNGADINLTTTSELFAGAEVYTKSDLKDGTAGGRPINLYRRVAGIKGWFKGLPEKIDGSTVATVELRLYDALNTKTHFLPQMPDGYTEPKDVPDAEYEDYITSPYNGNEGDIIARYTVNTADKDEFNLGAYMLPAAKSAQQGVSTLCLYFLDADGKELTSRRVLYRVAENNSQTRSGTGIIDIDDTNGDSPNYHYPIRANQFYRMGTKDSPIDLSGQANFILIDIDPVWDEYYGGAMDNEYQDGVNIDKTWGEHEGGKLD